MDNDIERVEPIPGSPALIRKGQLLTDASGMAATARWADAVTETQGIYRVRLSSGVDVCDLVASVRERGFPASPNHVLTGQPLYFGGPASRPFPSPALPMPEPAADGPATTAVTVALADTGLASHPWWRKSPWFLEQGQDSAEVPDSDGDGELDLQAGHGTFITGLLLRSAPAARPLPIRMLSGHGIGDEAGLLHVLERLRAEPPRVLNLSFGGHTFDDGPSPLVEAALAELAGTVTVACAGNTASDRPFWPAASPRVIAVGALDAAERDRAPFSAYGPWVDACARGEWLSSTFLEHGAFRGYACWSGTSFAAALVSGAIAAASADRPSQEAVEHVLAPAGARRIPDLGVVVPTPG
ncbi:S8/S53 family peptidase [Streptosporangium sp. NBC_01755]|uniref:S8 family peptidase n=1 Tax=unclassified Streptosporangium TaxID=2632669 RepID=UPI002DDC8CBD|nr:MULTISPECIES: S8/S53 family peptidase [unclassified Streptosporangium]WSA27192.1 S8/S53 family peptidase [Streptosporangium sp. NBC_01810]WSD01254.1 S8/S53 family peptidase [Streptosporangium sp. NBC_01755]